MEQLDEHLMTSLSKAIERHLGQCNNQELANIAWAFAKTDHKDERLFSALARMAERQAEHFNAQELTNVTHGRLQRLVILMTLYSKLWFAVLRNV